MGSGSGRVLLSGWGRDYDGGYYHAGRVSCRRGWQLGDGEAGYGRVCENAL